MAQFKGRYNLLIETMGDTSKLKKAQGFVVSY